MYKGLKYIYLIIFIVGFVLIYDNTIGFYSDGSWIEEVSNGIVNDNRMVYFCISLFGLVGFFIEIIFQKLETLYLIK